MTTVGEGIFEQNTWAKSVRSTLIHLVGAQARYIARLSGEPAVDLNPSARLADLRAVAASTGARLTELATSMDAGQLLELNFQSEKYEVQASVIPAQVINHATEHRSHVRTILSQHGIDSPELDAWAWGDASGKLTKG